MSMLQTGLAVMMALVLAPVLGRIGAPAPILLAGMMIGAAARLTEVAPGGVSHWVAYIVLAAIGTLIGTRFSGIALRDLRACALAGFAGTLLATGLATAAAVAAAPIVGMPLVHVLVAFAPGGLETMAALGAAIGANAGFVAAAHVGRLLLLSVLVPTLLARARRQADRQANRQA
jgi:membrane AbrB-like protein